MSGGAAPALPTMDLDDSGSTWTTRDLDDSVFGPQADFPDASGWLEPWPAAPPDAQQQEASEVLVFDVAAPIPDMIANWTITSGAGNLTHLTRIQQEQGLSAMAPGFDAAVQYANADLRKVNEYLATVRSEEYIHDALEHMPGVSDSLMVYAQNWDRVFDYDSQLRRQSTDPGQADLLFHHFFLWSEKDKIHNTRVRYYTQPYALMLGYFSEAVENCFLYTQAVSDEYRFYFSQLLSGPSFTSALGAAEPATCPENLNGCFAPVDTPNEFVKDCFPHRVPELETAPTDRHVPLNLGAGDVDVRTTLLIIPTNAHVDTMCGGSRVMCTTRGPDGEDEGGGGEKDLGEYSSVQATLTQLLHGVNAEFFCGGVSFLPMPQILCTRGASNTRTAANAAFVTSQIDVMGGVFDAGTHTARGFQSYSVQGVRSAFVKRLIVDSDDVLFYPLRTDSLEVTVGTPPQTIIVSVMTDLFAFANRVRIDADALLTGLENVHTTVPTKIARADSSEEKPVIPKNYVYLNKPSDNLPGAAHWRFVRSPGVAGRVLHARSLSSPAAIANFVSKDKDKMTLMSPALFEQVKSGWAVGPCVDTVGDFAMMVLRVLTLTPPGSPSLNDSAFAPTERFFAPRRRFPGDPADEAVFWDTTVERQRASTEVYALRTLNKTWPKARKPVTELYYPNALDIADTSETHPAGLTPGTGYTFAVDMPKEKTVNTDVNKSTGTSQPGFAEHEIALDQLAWHRVARRGIVSQRSSFTDFVVSARYFPDFACLGNAPAAAWLVEQTRLVQQVLVASHGKMTVKNTSKASGGRFHPYGSLAMPNFLPCLIDAATKEHTLPPHARFGPKNQAFILRALRLRYPVTHASATTPPLTVAEPPYGTTAFPLCTNLNLLARDTAQAYTDQVFAQSHTNILPRCMPFITAGHKNTAERAFGRLVAMIGTLAQHSVADMHVIGQMIRRATGMVPEVYQDEKTLFIPSKGLALGSDRSPNAMYAKLLGDDSSPSNLLHATLIGNLHRLGVRQTALYLLVASREHIEAVLEDSAAPTGSGAHATQYAAYRMHTDPTQHGLQPGVGDAGLRTDWSGLTVLGNQALARGRVVAWTDGTKTVSQPAIELVSTPEEMYGGGWGQRGPQRGLSSYGPLVTTEAAEDADGPFVTTVRIRPSVMFGIFFEFWNDTETESLVFDDGERDLDIERGELTEEMKAAFWPHYFSSDYNIFVNPDNGKNRTGKNGVKKPEPLGAEDQKKVERTLRRMINAEMQKARRFRAEEENGGYTGGLSLWMTAKDRANVRDAALGATPGHPFGLNKQLENLKKWVAEKGHPQTFDTTKYAWLDTSTMNTTKLDTNGVVCFADMLNAVFTHAEAAGCRGYDQKDREWYVDYSVPTNTLNAEQDLSGLHPQYNIVAKGGNPKKQTPQRAAFAARTHPNEAACAVRHLAAIRELEPSLLGVVASDNKNPKPADKLFFWYLQRPELSNKWSADVADVVLAPNPPRYGLWGAKKWLAAAEALMDPNHDVDGAALLMRDTAEAPADGLSRAAASNIAREVEPDFAGAFGGSAASAADSGPSVPVPALVNTRFGVLTTGPAPMVSLASTVVPDGSDEIPMGIPPVPDTTTMAFASAPQGYEAPGQGAAKRPCLGVGTSPAAAFGVESSEPGHTSMTLAAYMHTGWHAFQGQHPSHDSRTAAAQRQGFGETGQSAAHAAVDDDSDDEVFTKAFLSEQEAAAALFPTGVFAPDAPGPDDGGYEPDDSGWPSSF